MQKKITIIRHAESLGNAGVATATTDSNALSELGKKQAQELAKKISITPELIVVSKYIRTQETAAPYKDLFPSTTYEVWNVHEFTYLDSKKYFNTTQEQRSIPRKEYWERCDPTYCDGEGAESFQAFFSRIEDCIAKLQSYPVHRIVVFTHELFILGMEFILEKKISSNTVAKEDMQEFFEYTYSKRIPNAVSHDFSSQILAY